CPAPRIFHLRPQRAPSAPRRACKDAADGRASGGGTAGARFISTRGRGGAGLRGRAAPVADNPRRGVRHSEGNITMSDASGVERTRRWRLVLGGDDQTGLSERDRRLDAALAGLYEANIGNKGKAGANRRGSLGGSAPRVASWLGDIREFFPAPVVQ